MTCDLFLSMNKISVWNYVPYTKPETETPSLYSCRGGLSSVDAPCSGVPSFALFCLYLHLYHYLTDLELFFLCC